MADIGINVSLCDRADQLGAGGHRRAPVAEVAAREDGTSQEQRADSCSPSDKHADDAHGAEGPKGGSCEKGHDRTQQKGAEDEKTGLDKPDRMTQDKWNRAADPPACCQGTDEEKDEENVGYFRHTLFQHQAGTFKRIPLVDAVDAETDHSE